MNIPGPAACLVALFSVSGFSAPSSYNIHRVEIAPIVDGNLQEWSNEMLIDSLRSDDNIFARDNLFPWTREDFQYLVYAVHDNAKVYFGLKLLADEGFQTGTGTGCDDSWKINPGGKATAFYIFHNGTIPSGPSCPFAQGSTLFVVCIPTPNLPNVTAEFSLDKSVLDPFGMGVFQLCVGFEEGDTPDCMDTHYGGIGVEYLGNKQDWSSNCWDNPIYYPTFTLVNEVVYPPLACPYAPALIPMTSPSFNRRPLFQWSASSVITTYRLLASYNTDFSNPVISLPVADTFYRAQANLAFGTLYWKVGDFENQSCWTDTSSVLILDILVPVIIPVFPDPTSLRKPLFRWHAVDSADSYTIQINTSADFSSAFITQPVSDTFYVPGVNLPMGKIYWRVRSDLSAQYSLAGSFLIQTDSIPLIMPVKPETLAVRRPAMTWHPARGALTYKVQVDTSDRFSNPLVSMPVSDTFFLPAFNLPPGRICWRVSNMDYDESKYSVVDTFFIKTLISLEETPAAVAPVSFGLAQNYPNPFNPGTTIAFTVPGKSGRVSIRVYDLKGGLVKTLLEGLTPAGYHQIEFNGRTDKGGALAPGIYICKMKAQGFRKSVKMFMMK